MELYSLTNIYQPRHQDKDLYSQKITSAAFSDESRHVKENTKKFNIIEEKQHIPTFRSWNQEMFGITAWKSYFLFCLSIYWTLFKLPSL